MSATIRRPAVKGNRPDEDVMRKYSVYLENTEMGGALNPAIIGFNFSDSAADLVLSPPARITGYLRALQYYKFMAPFKIAKMTVINTAGPSPAPVTITKIDDAELVYFNDKVKPAYELVTPGIGVLFASTCSLDVRGSSINVAENGAVGGRKGSGRHYLPFLATGNIDAQGLLDTQRATLITEFYSFCFLGGISPQMADAGADTIDAVLPVNASGPTNITNAITGVTPSTLISVLKSRRR